ncbi:SMC-Scp complex subunit ScpB [Ectothiorhodospira magna]|nr:SMC-Scp complex subunit ScpB [Ectothiorhodospira magna]
MTPELLCRILEGALLAADRPLSLEQMERLFEDAERPSRAELRQALEALARACDDRGYALRQVGSGYRFQVREALSPWISRLWEERPPRYSRALLETLALIAYRQPITRAEIEAVRGVTVSTQIIKTLTEREWVRVVGHKEVPGRPALYGTTPRFLDYFNLSSLDDLPSLMALKDLGPAQQQDGEPPVP